MADRGGLPETLDTLRRRWKLALLIVVPIVAGAAFYVEALSPSYDGTAVVAFTPKPNVPIASAQTLQLVLPKYIAYITADATLDRVAKTLGEDRTVLQRGIDARVPTETG